MAIGIQFIPRADRPDTLSPTPQGLASREQSWLRALRDGRFEARWYRVGNVLWSSAIKIDGVRIVLTYANAIEAAKALDARLPTKKEADAMFRAARHIPPVHVRPVSTSIEAIKLHSDYVDRLISNGDPFVDNEGKLWLAGAPPGLAVNYGWPDRPDPNDGDDYEGAKLRANGLHMWQDIGQAHNRLHTDYSQTLRVVRDCPQSWSPDKNDTEPSMSAINPKPTMKGDGMPPANPSRDVMLWQEYLNAGGYGPLSVDGKHWTATQRATEAWRRDHDDRPTAPPSSDATVAPPIVTCAAWGAVARPVQPPSAAQGIVVHHMALGSVATEERRKRGALRTPGATFEAELAAAKALARNLQASHIARGWADTGQDFSVSRGGVILEGRTGALDAARRGMVVAGAHAKGPANVHHWGIEFEGDYTKGSFYGDATPTIPQAQWRAGVDLIRWLIAMGRLDPNTIKGHSEIPGNATGCPGTLLQLIPKIISEL